MKSMKEGLWILKKIGIRILRAVTFKILNKYFGLANRNAYLHFLAAVKKRSHTNSQTQLLNYSKFQCFASLSSALSLHWNVQHPNSSSKQ